MTAPAFLSLAFLSDDDHDLVDLLQRRLSVFQGRNREAFERYEGTWVTRDLGISTPPTMKSLHTVAGWAGTTVDVLEERLDWQGWRTSSDDDFGLGEVYRQNHLAVESGSGHLDALICGVSFVSVGTGVDGEPDPLVQVHSPQSMTVVWDRRLRRPTSALALGADVATLYKSGETIQLEADAAGRWKVVDRDRHNLPRLPVVPLLNRRRGSRQAGRSEITAPVRYYSDAAARTLKGLEANREFYTAPKMVGLNMNPEDFEDEQGKKVDQWSAVMGRLWLAPPNEAGEAEPRMTQLSPSSPAPYLDQIRSYAQLLAAEAGIPASYLGFATDNPASADAIHAGEARLVKRAERRQAGFGMDWVDVGAVVLMVRDGAVPPDFYDQVSSKWKDADTPTRAAAADATAKLIGAGVLPASSQVTYDRIGLSPDEQEVLTAELRRSSGASLLDKVSGGALTPAGQDADQAKALQQKFEALGIAIRAGVSPESAARLIGLDGITFTGAIPVTLRVPESQATHLEDA